jgi:predicted DNA-binding transcriptional regulator YafY
MAKKQRSDADRRVRQCERLGRLLRLLHLIMGKGRWDASTLAEELECSRRTVYRLLQTLSMAGVPWYFDESSRAYRVRPGFKFSLVEKEDASAVRSDTPQNALDSSIQKIVNDTEQLIVSLRQFLDVLQRAR